MAGNSSRLFLEVGAAILLGLASLILCLAEVEVEWFEDRGVREHPRTLLVWGWGGAHYPGGRNSASYGSTEGCVVGRGHRLLN